MTQTGLEKGACAAQRNAAKTFEEVQSYMEFADIWASENSADKQDKREHLAFWLTLACHAQEDAAKNYAQARYITDTIHGDYT